MKKELTQDIFRNQPEDVDWAGVDYDGLLSFGKAINPRYTYDSERWRGFTEIGEPIENSGFKPLTQIKRIKIEDPYFDKNGVQIKEFALIKIFHYVGRRNKKNYLYKWVQLKEYNGFKSWVALHLEDGSGDYFHLRNLKEHDRILSDVEIVQQRSH